MPQLSRRGQQVPPSPIRKLVPHAVEAKRRGIHVFHLNIGQPDIATPDAFLRAVRDWPGPVVAYEHSQGREDLIRAFQSYYRGVGVELETAEIQVTTGGSEALLFGMACVANPGEKLVVFEPFYTNYQGFAAQLGIDLVPITSDPQTGYHLPSRSDIEARLDASVRGILLCNPNNPTGTVYTPAEVETLADICKTHDLYLLADEVYREFCYEGEHRSTLDLPGLEQHVVLTDSLSKRLSACGARVGVLVSRNRAVMQAALYMAQARLSSPSLEMIGSAAALEAPDTPRFIGETVSEYRRRRDIVLAGVRAIPGGFCETPQGAFYVMATLPVADTEDFARWLLTDFERDGKTVMVAPGPGFYVTPGRGHQEVRIAYVLNTADLETAMRLLGEAVEAYQGVTAGT